MTPEKKQDFSRSKGDKLKDPPQVGKPAQKVNATAHRIFAEDNVYQQKQLAASKRASRLPQSSAQPVRMVRGSGTSPKPPRPAPAAPRTTSSHMMKPQMKPMMKQEQAMMGSGGGVMVPQAILQALLARLPSGEAAAILKKLGL